MRCAGLSKAAVRSALVCLGVATVLSACVVPDDLLEGRPCPCVTGYVCERPRDVCVRQDSVDAAVLDAFARDASLDDAGQTDAALDAARADAAASDAAASDAAPRDAAVPDAGSDAGVGAGLVAWYPCETLVPTGIADRSGHGHHAVCSGAQCPDIIAGPRGGACDFDGVAQYGRVPYDAAFGITGGFSISVWLFVRATVGSAVSQPLGTMRSNSWQVYLTNELTTPVVSFITSTGTGLTTPLTLSTWHHYVMTWDGVDKRLYVDGTLAGRVPLATMADMQDIFIGADWNAGALDLPFDGMLDELRIYDRPVTAAEVAILASE